MNTSNMTFTERIAAYTWRILKHSWEYNVRLGEETLTDLLTLNFMRFKPSYYILLPINKQEESKIGADLDIRIHAGDHRAYWFAVQAKKLFPPNKRYSGCYYTFKVKSSGPSQIDILETYSRSVGAIPFYLLYNYVDQRNMQPYWHCCQCLDKEQLGCTLVPSWTIRRAISTRRGRNFKWIHKSCDALPWRCLFDCSKGRNHQLLPSACRSLSMFHESSQQSDDDQNYDWVNFEPVDGAWPEWLWEQQGSTLSAEDRQRLWGDLGEAVEIPRRLLLVKGGTE